MCEVWGLGENAVLSHLSLLPPLPPTSLSHITPQCPQWIAVQLTDKSPAWMSSGEPVVSEVDIPNVIPGVSGQNIHCVLPVKYVRWCVSFFTERCALWWRRLIFPQGCESLNMETSLIVLYVHTIILFAQIPQSNWNMCCTHSDIWCLIAAA